MFLFIISLISFAFCLFYWYESYNKKSESEFDYDSVEYKALNIKKSIAVFVFVMSVVINLLSPSDEEKSPQINESTTKTTVVQKEIPMPVGEEAEKTEIFNIMRNSTKDSDFRDATITKIYEKDKYNLVIFLNSQFNFTTNLVYDNYKDTAKKIFKEIYTSRMGNKINDVKINFYENMVNKKTGEKHQDIIYMLAMNYERASQMHWENLDYVDIEMAATEKFIHPALQNALEKK